MLREIEIIRPPHVRNRLHHVTGMAILAANSVRHRVMGYRTPRPTSAKRVDQALRYDRAVVENWLRHLSDYLGRDFSPTGKHVLELGPGPDLGTGLLLLAAGAETYTAVDAHRLVRRGTSGLHLRIARAAARWEVKREAERQGEDRASAGLPDRRPVNAGAEGPRSPATVARTAAALEPSVDPGDLAQRLREAVEAFHRGGEGPLRYLVRPDFDLTALGEQRFDLVVSHSALEHVAHFERCFEQIAEHVSDRAHFVAEVDLQTHTRWIRDSDPLNIYRYTRSLYRSCSFSGVPNRKRPDDYLKILERTGWYDLRQYPKRVLEPEYVALVEPSLDPAFQGDPERLGWLSMVVCASRRGDRSWGGRQG